ncbi:putative MND1 domain-containing protein [Scenedesmus sp. NREL 46B-D3]|nr:putative MND1 domain-containing protein [Scenedesmus sp. NREL 46B-D3]
MSKRKGLSLEEKRDKVLEVFTESADVFVLKDVEKLAARKGVVLQTIKEVLQSLVDDGMVNQEKIGSSNYFWAFPAEQSTKIINDIERTKHEIAAAEKRQQEMVSQVQQAKQGKEDSSDREQLMIQLRQLQAEVEAQQQELQQYADSDPELLAHLSQAAQYAREAANRWQENVFALQGWCKQKFAGREGDVDTFFKDQGFNEDAEYFA